MFFNGLGRGLAAGMILLFSSNVLHCAEQETIRDLSLLEPFSEEVSSIEAEFGEFANEADGIQKRFDRLEAECVRRYVFLYQIHNSLLAKLERDFVEVRGQICESHMSLERSGFREFDTACLPDVFARSPIWSGLLALVVSGPMSRRGKVAARHLISLGSRGNGDASIAALKSLVEFYFDLLCLRKLNGPDADDRMARLSLEALAACKVKISDLINCAALTFTEYLEQGVMDEENCRDSIQLILRLIRVIAADVEAVLPMVTKYFSDYASAMFERIYRESAWEWGVPLACGTIGVVVDTAAYAATASRRRGWTDAQEFQFVIARSIGHLTSFFYFVLAIIDFIRVWRLR